jgi:exopolyphosphatase/guanosine-5'-triphosphate,3'-diphosphate pyrophosphatase
MKIAIFDIGTNSIHLLVVEIKRGLFYEVLLHKKDTTRLGEGSFESKKLSRSTMAKAVRVLAHFRRIAKKNGAKKMIAVATSAVREAKNRPKFLSEVHRKTGLRVRVISGKEEGELIFLGALSSARTLGRRMLVMDVGGGSVELTVGDSKRNYYNQSFGLGAVRLTEQFIEDDPPSRKELRRLDRFIQKNLKKPAKRIRRFNCPLVIGTSGTMNALSAMASKDHTVLLKRNLEKLRKKLEKTTLEKRRRLSGLHPRRADIIIAGCVLVDNLMRLLKIRQIVISKKGIREGVLLDFMRRNR